MNIYCLSEGELYNIENGKEHLVHCERVESYRDAVRKMKARDEYGNNYNRWKKSRIYR